jgi:hypothetical protein
MRQQMMVRKCLVCGKITGCIEGTERRTCTDKCDVCAIPRAGYPITSGYCQKCFDEWRIEHEKRKMANRGRVQ